MTDPPMLADGCSDRDRLRVRMAVTGESLAQASRALADYPAPTAAEIQAADRTPYDPVFFGMFAGDVEAGLRRYRQYAWVDQAGSVHSVRNRVGEPGPDGQLVLIAGADWYRGLPLLTLQCTAIAEGHGKGIAVWWTSFGIELGERGCTGSTRGGSTLRWRVELAPDPDDTYAPTAVRVHDGAGWTLFDSVTFAPLGWTVRTRIHPGRPPRDRRPDFRSGVASRPRRRHGRPDARRRWPPGRPHPRRDWNRPPGSLVAMITDRGGAAIDDAVALNRIVAALDLRLPTEITAESKANRLFEEVGGLAASIVVLEHDATWTPANEAAEPLGAMNVLDVLCAIGRVAHHHHVRLHSPDLGVADSSGNPYLLLALLTQAGGAIVEAGRHVTAASTQHEGNRALAFDRLMWAVDNAVTRTMAIANHYQLRDDLRISLQNTYREYQLAGFLPGAVTDES